MAVLTIIFIMDMCNQVLPPVSYIKLGDWYLISSTLFVGCVFLEYILVLWLTQNEIMRCEKVAEERKKAINKNKNKYGILLLIYNLCLLFKSHIHHRLY